MSSVVYVRQFLAIANMNYTVLVIKLSHESSARTIGCSSIVSGWHVRHNGINTSLLGHTKKACHIPVARQT